MNQLIKGWRGNCMLNVGRENKDAGEEVWRNQTLCRWMADERWKGNGGRNQFIRRI